MVSFKLFSMCVMYIISVKSEFTTLKTYMDLPELDPITIVEGDPLWEDRNSVGKFLNRFDNLQTTPPVSTNIYNPLIVNSDEKNSEFTATSLKKFLDEYAERIKQETNLNNNQSLILDNQDEDKRKKNGNLLNLKQYNPPNEDKNGWVSLEPIPWSVSQISKWHSKPNPTENVWNQYPDDEIVETPKPSLPTRYKLRPQINKNKIEVYQSDQLEDLNAMYKRPFTFYRPAPQISLPESEIISHKNDIITDGLAPNFPKKLMTYNRRHGTELNSEQHSFTGNGNWVLLSTSKGYKYPKRQRSITLKPELINTHKSVQLTVLPPLKESKINMTTSHGGLLQVESTFEPVEQAQKKFQKIQKIKNKRKRPNQAKRKKKIQTLQSVRKSLPRTTDNSGAVLAGVGAGLIPATMAMMVPLVMNGRKRRRRNVQKIPQLIY